MSGGAAGGAAAVSLTRTPATPEPTGTPGQGAGLAEGRRSDPGAQGCGGLDIEQREGDGLKVSRQLCHISGADLPRPRPRFDPGGPVRDPLQVLPGAEQHHAEQQRRLCRWTYATMRRGIGGDAVAGHAGV